MAARISEEVGTFGKGRDFRKGGMGLLDRFVQWRTDVRIRSLEQALAFRPTPMLYLQLADAHEYAGNQSKAAQVLKLGAARFRDSAEVVRRQAEAEQTERDLEKKRLIERIQNHPNPILYARLAELYKAEDDISRTVDTCQRGIKAFPKYGGTYLVLGQMYFDKKQWAEAAGQFEKSVSLDKFNYLALKLLSQVYLELKRPADAVQRLENVRSFAPGDETILELLKKAQEALNRQQGKANGSLAEAATLSNSRLPSRNGSGVRPILVSSRNGFKSPKDQLYARGLADMRAVAGVLGAILVDQYGLVVASNLDPSFDEGLAGALMSNVYRATSTHALKLGVGQFEEGFIEGTDGNIHIVQFDDMIMTVFAKTDVKLGLLEKNIRDFSLAVFQAR